ncbi:hypothetical protein J7E99_17675 [Streptomyces sp. ISL-44]|uniref:hypothetical protein n=1 Tax=Streptomyces sp. ISL-44 TaxID=2819184 RepID=UPI001BE68E30|nr:hypothetical protein [Streptomyces sp. ISL-44]MBT2542497.1 hypothetical protein [Streptomyces sp. ISL-44]
MHAFTHARIHAARTAELAAAAAAWHLASSADTTPALRDRLGEALVAAGMRLMQPAHIHARLRQQHAA